MCVLTLQLRLSTRRRAPFHRYAKRLVEEDGRFINSSQEISTPTGAYQLLMKKKTIERLEDDANWPRFLASNQRAENAAAATIGSRYDKRACVTKLICIFYIRR